MQKLVEIKVLPKDIKNEEFIKSKAATAAQFRLEEVTDWRIKNSSLDARQRTAFYILKIEIASDENLPVEPAILDNFQDVSGKDTVLIVGAGPTGYFAALELIELGLKPIVFDRGKDVRARRRDLKAIQQYGEVNPHSNYCFGEGGAGTYSDGKLYTRSHKRGKISKALQLLVEHGSNPDILVEAHPHIGSNKLPNIVANIRETILHYGGEVHFDSLVTDLIIENNVIKGVVVNDKEEFFAKATVIATGHSARDMYKLLDKKGVRMEAKPFALGVRIEHSQSFIDQVQYNQTKREENLPAASYKLACQVRGRGVFSFCMCPGGLVVPAATSPGEIVVNGMSMSRRDSPYANSGTVVAVNEADLEPFKKHGVFAAMELQKQVEQGMFNMGDGSQKAPSLRLTDFARKRMSKDLPDSSYIPGLFPAPIYDILPKGIYNRLRDGVQVFGKKMNGYFTENANVIGTESRTSSPIRIPRDRTTYMHEEIEGLFPAGEGAGYAGGIISAAMDGQNVAKGIFAFYGK